MLTGWSPITIPVRVLIDAAERFLDYIEDKPNEKQLLRTQITNLEEQKQKFEEFFLQLKKEREETEAKFRAAQEASLEEQRRKEEQLEKEKEEMKKEQAERERLMEKRQEQCEQKQKEMIEAIKEHHRLLAEDAKKGLKRCHAEKERQIALDRERLAKEGEFLRNARLEHERCLKEERERFQQTKASCERAMEEDRQRLELQMNTFAEAQKKWDNESVVMQQNYDKLLTKLDEGRKNLQHEQRESEKRLKSKMEDMMDEQKNLTVLEKEQKLKDLTETYFRYCQMYGNDPEIMITETKEFQREFMFRLMQVKNSMQAGGSSLRRLKIWAHGATFHLKMLTFLSQKGVFKHEALQAANQQYQRDMCSLVSPFDASIALPENVEEIRAIEQSFHNQVQEVECFINRALTASSSPLLDIGAPAATKDNILSPTWNECATTRGAISSVPAGLQVHLMSGNPTNDGALEPVLDQKPQTPGDASWARCDVLAQSLRESSLRDQTQISECTSSTRSDTLLQSLRQSAFEDQPQLSGSAQSTVQE